MRKTLFVFAVVLLVLAVLSLAFSALCRYAAYHTLDGSPGLRSRQLMMHYVSLAAGILLAAASVLLFVRRHRLIP